MRKLFFFGAVIITSLSMAKTKDAKLDQTFAKETELLKFEHSLNVKNLKVKMLIKSYYVVEFDLPCGGGHMTVTFASSYADGSPEFINDLANTVNSGVDQGCAYKAQFGL